MNELENYSVMNEITAKINNGTATQEDYIELIKVTFAPTPWAIEPVLGIFRCNVGMGKTLKESFDAATETFSRICAPSRCKEEA